MPMIPFHSWAGKRAFDEMRVIDGKNCDCRRVIFQVRREDIPEKVYAAINFGWESPEYYVKWVRDAKRALKKGRGKKRI